MLSFRNMNIKDNLFSKQIFLEYNITSPKMKASDYWLNLCSFHKKTTECLAIDYMIHNLDQMTTILNNSKLFNDRVSI